MNYCKVCGRKLELTPEYDMCIECQGKQHRTFTLPYNDGVNANHTEMTAKEALYSIKKLFTDEYNFPFNLTIEYKVLYQALTELEELKKLISEYFKIPKAGEIFKNPFEQNALYLNIMKIVGGISDESK